MSYTERYVTTSGSSGNGGTNDTTDAWNLATGIANCGPAIRLNIKAGAYSTNNLNFTSAGTPTSAQPCHIRGYGTTPGDGDLGRGTDYKRITTNMPAITFNAGQGLTVNKAFITIENLKIVGNCNNNLVGLSNYAVYFLNCVINNANGSNNANAYGIYGNCACMNCDFITGGSAHYGGVYAEQNSTFIGCYFLGTGLSTSVALGHNNSIVAISNVFNAYGVGIQRNYTGGNYTKEIVIGNTFYAISNKCYEDFNAASSAVTHTVLLNNHATDSGKFVHNTSANNVLLLHNRTRDNSSANANMGESLEIGTITTDNGAAASDFASPSAPDFTLVPGAAGKTNAFQPNRDIGALQSPPMSNATF